MRQTRILLVLGAILAFNVFAFAMIDTVQVSVYPYDEDVDESEELHPNGGFFDGFRLPLIAGKTHRFTVRGSGVDHVHGIKLEGAGVDNFTISSSQITKSNDKIVFTVPGSSINDSGTIKITILYTTSPFMETFECRVDHRGAIESAEWVGPNIPVTDSNPYTETSHLVQGLQYTLRFNGHDFPPSQFYDGNQSRYFGQPGFTITNTATAIDVTFRVTRDTQFRIVSGPGTIVTPVSFADSTVGNIDGGWGNYVYHRMASLPFAGNFTNLAGVYMGGGYTNTTSPPDTVTTGGSVPQPDLMVTFLNAFRSGTLFAGTEASIYNVCPTAITTNPRITTIPGLKVRVQNVGTANAGGFNVTITRMGANVITPVAVAGLNAGASRDIDIPRPENRVCATTDLRNPSVCIRCGSGVQGIDVWNDLGITATVGPIANEISNTNNTQTIR